VIDRLDYAPGTLTEYVGAGVDLPGLVVEVVQGVDK